MGSFVLAILIAAVPAYSTTPSSGCCGDTDPQDSCNSSSAGEWTASGLGIHTLDDCVRHCRSLKCSECNFVSFSVKHDDCSWYRQCDLDHLMHIADYTSVQVRTPPKPPKPPSTSVTIPLNPELLRTTNTTPTIEVDVMPFLGQTSEGGPHDKAFYWLGQLGADLVRFAPWFPNPRVVVAELEEPDCKRNFTSWNITLLDQIYSDFAAAVGNRTVAMQLSTLPSWMYTDGYPLEKLPKDPWQPNMDYGRVGGNLRDPTCREVARYIARLVGWFTAGGFTDECGRWHDSGHRYKWALLSVLNEVTHEHFYQGYGKKAAKMYTTCYDAIVDLSRKVNPTLRFAGPELGPEDWKKERDNEFLEYFLDPANHETGAPDFLSYHYPGAAMCDAEVPADSSVTFTHFDCWINQAVIPVEQARQKIAPKTQVLVNEIYPDDIPHDAVDHGLMNRKTTTWNLAAAFYGYAVGRLAEQGVLVVGQDQLAGGTSPDNEPVVSCLDWKTGDPNAKYYSIQMLASAFGSGAKDLFAIDNGNTEAFYVLPFRRADDGKRRLLIVNKLSKPLTLELHGRWCVAGSGRMLGADDVPEPGFQSPRPLQISRGMVNLSAHALATIVCQSAILENAEVMV